MPVVRVAVIVALAGGFFGVGLIAAGIVAVTLEEFVDQDHPRHSEQRAENHDEDLQTRE